MSGQEARGDALAGEGSPSEENRRITPPARRICVLVLGMHRSGTSALTRVLSIAGARLPANLNASDGGNSTGYWESDLLIRYDDALLAQLGSSWRDWRELNVDKLPAGPRAEIVTEIAGLIRREFGEAPLIVVKEPRICRFAPLFARAVEEAGYDCRYVLPIRSPLEVVDSLDRRDGMSRGEAGLLWLRHVLDAELSTRNARRVLISFDGLLANWRQTFVGLSERLGIDWVYSAEEIEGQVESFLSPEQRHHRSKIEDVVLDPMLRSWVGDAYSALLVLERNPSSVAALGVLDRIRLEFNGASPIIDRLVSEISESRDREVGQFKQELERAAERELVLAGKLDHLENALRAERAERMSDIEQAERKRNVVEAQAENLAIKVNELEVALAAATDAADRQMSLQQAILSQREAEAEIARVEAQELSSRLKSLNHDLSVAAAERTCAEASMAAAYEQILRAQSEILAVRSELTESVRQSELLSSQLSALNQTQAELERSQAAAEGRAARAEDDALELRRSLEQKDVHLHLIGTSASWRLTRPLRGLKRVFVDAEFRRALPSRLWSGARRRLGWGGGAAPATGEPLRRWTLPWARHVARGVLGDQVYRQRMLRRATRAVRGSTSAHSEPVAHLAQQSDINGLLDSYDAWRRANALTDAGRRDLEAALALRARRTPKISAIMPVYNSEPRLLREAVESVCSQIYENWELCLVDDGSSSKHVRPLLAELARTDNRIRVKHRERNGGISECTNTAVSFATGDVIAFVDHDDLITPDCFAELALYYADHDDADVVYSDDDKVDMAGRRFAPQFKPDYAPTLLLSYMYIGHIFSVRRNLFEALGGFRKAFDGSQDYDFALRAVEQARHVGHIPKVLYSWRVAPGSTAASADEKPESFEAGRQAVSEALDRRGLKGTALHPEWSSRAKCGIFAVSFPDDGPRVTLIIPTKDRLDLLRPCLDSLSKTTYQNYDVMIVDNDSTEPDTLAYLEELEKRPRIRVERISNAGLPFNYARVNNEAVRRSSAEYVLLLNNDTAVREPRWLSQMIGHAQMKGVGAVGAKLLFEDGAIQHAGIVHGMYDGLAGPAFRNRDCHDWGYLGFLKVSREYSAVTAACLLVRRDLFESVGGLDEVRFGVAYNDVDLCYRLIDQGYRCIYCADAELLHFEGKSRGMTDNPRELAAFRSLYDGRYDPWYNPNLSLDDEQFRVRGARLPRRNARPVRAVMISHNLEHEGAPNSMLELVSGLKRRGFADPIVLSPLDGPLRAHYEAAGVEVRVIRNPIADVYNDPDFAASMGNFADALRALNPEIVYANTLQTFWAICGARAAGLPSIWNPRESEPWDRYFDYLAPALRAHAYRSFDYAYAVAFVAHATRANWAPALTRHNSRVIHNGISSERLMSRDSMWTRERARNALSASDDDVVVALVGTVCERKGQLDLIEAIQLVSTSSKARVRMFVVGDRAGPYSERIHAAVDKLPPALRARVTIVAETGDPYLYFRAADIAVCTSRVESYPRVVLEAMAYGLPIVTTSVFGIVEQVRESVNALFYEQGQPARLARQLDRLISDDDLRLKMADNSLLVLRGLTQFDQMIDAYAKVFREAAVAPISE